MYSVKFSPFIAFGKWLTIDLKLYVLDEFGIERKLFTSSLNIAPEETTDGLARVFEERLLALLDDLRRTCYENQFGDVARCVGLISGVVRNICNEEYEGTSQDFDSHLVYILQKFMEYSSRLSHSIEGSIPLE